LGQDQNMVFYAAPFGVKILVNVQYSSFHLIPGVGLLHSAGFVISIRAWPQNV
jgi:hypothetical protein